jgi:D-amino peptidase
MKIYIHTDIEGVAGWVFYTSASTQQANLDHARRMNKLLTAEVSAACHAALDAGANEVLVNDAHGPCYSIDFEELPPGCQIIHGRPGYFDHWLPCFDETVSALVCIGQHAMAATPRSVCPHSMWHINDRRLSETTLAAALAGSFDVPCICVTGDQAICQEVTGAIPGIETVTVKWGLSAQNARSLCPQEACRNIHNGVRAAILRRHDIAPFKLPGPYRINISDRDPSHQLLPQPYEGNDLWQATRAALNLLPYGHYGQDPIDDRSYRYPC